MKRVQIVIILLIFSFLKLPLCIASKEWREDFDSLIKASSSLKSRSLNIWLSNASQCDVDILLGVIHVYSQSGDRACLNQIAQIACKRAKPHQMLDVSLICQSACLPHLARKAGTIAIEQAAYCRDLATMSQEFHAANLKDLSFRAARKAVANIPQSNVCFPYESFNVGKVLSSLHEYDLAQQAFEFYISQEDCWSYLLNAYYELKAIGKHASAELAFTKILNHIERNNLSTRATNLAFVAHQCGKNGYSDDSKRALQLAIEQEQDPDSLLSHVSIAQSNVFDDLTERGLNRVIDLFQGQTYISNIKKLCSKLIEMHDQERAIKLCEIAITKCDDLNSLPTLFEIIDSLNKMGEKSVRDNALKLAINLCAPQDGLLFDMTSFCFLSPSVCLLIISKLSQICNQPSLALQAADQSIACALAEPYETPHELLSALTQLQRSITILQFHALSKKVGYYQTQIDNPTFRSLPPSQPQLFNIYWLKLEGTQGVEIIKARPWVVITRPQTYTKGKIVTVAPLSTKKRRETSSIPIWFREQQQEVRLDQARAVDISRLNQYYDILPINYQTQLLLAFQNFHSG